MLNRRRMIQIRAIPALVVLTLCAASHASPRQKLPVLTRAQQIRDLSPDQAERPYPVHLRAVINYLDSSIGELFVQDASNGVFVFISQSMSNLPLHSGQLVDIVGVTAKGDFVPAITKANITVLGNAPPPKALRLSFNQYDEGQHECQWLEVTGMVRSGQTKQGRLQLNVHTLGGNLVATMVDYPADWAKSLVRSRVTLHGVIAAIFNEHRQAIGVRMFIPAGEIHIVLPAPKDPFALPLTSIGSVGEARSTEEMQAIRVRSSVTAVESGAAIYLSDGTQNLEAQLSSSCGARAGDLVDVVGFRGSIDGRPALENSICRIAGRAAPIAPVAVDPDQVLPRLMFDDASGYGFAEDSRYDMRLIRIDGVLLQSSRGPTGATMVLGSSQRLFVANLPGSGSAFAEEPRVGSRLQLTGLCMIGFDQFRRGQSFRVLLRTPEDIVVLNVPSWWNAQHVTWIALLALAFSLGAASWIAILRRQVDHQTRELQRANESLRQLSDRDGLTGILNRRKFNEVLEVEFSRARRASSSVSLLMIDVDCFKALNDHYGHQRGDDCLLEVVESMESVSLRTDDLIARYGGEEFAVILPSTDHSGALDVAERLRAAVRARAIPHVLSPHNQLLSISVGVATIRPEQQDTSDALVQWADRALYSSKIAGRNCVTSMYDALPLLGKDAGLKGPVATEA